LTEINIGQRPAGRLGSGPVIKETTMRTALINADKVDADKVAEQQKKVDELRQHAPWWLSVETE
jgi:hypothetical protein